MMDVVSRPDIEQELIARHYYVHRAVIPPIDGKVEPEPIIDLPLPDIHIHEPHPGLPGVSDWLLGAAYAALVLASRERDILLV